MLLRQTMMLIQADERPAVVPPSVLANLASKRAARVSGESGVASRGRRWRSHGLAPERLATLPAPAYAFPATPDSFAARRRTGGVVGGAGAARRLAPRAAAARPRASSRRGARGAAARLDLT